MKPPKSRKSLKYIEIVKRGCGLRQYPYEGDWDCDHEYDWTCDDCPCSIENRKEKKNDKNNGTLIWG